MEPSRQRERAGFLFALASAALLAAVILIAKTLLRTMTPWVFTAYFFLVGAVAYPPYFLARRDALAFRPAAGAVRAGAVIGLCDVGYTLGYFHGLQQLNPAVAAFLGHTGEVLATLFGLIFLREAMSRAELRGMGLALAGLALVTARFEGASGSGVGSMLVAAVFFAVNAILIKRYTRRYDPIHLSFYRTVVLAAAMLALSASVLGIRAPRSNEWPLLLAAGVLGPFLNYLCFFSALARLEVSRVNVIRVSYSVLVLAGTITLYGQVPTTRQIVGGLGVVAGIVWMLYARSRALSPPARTSGPDGPVARR